MSMFSQDEMRRSFQELFGPDVVDHLPGERVSLYEFTNEAVDLLLRKDLIDTYFFDKLLEARHRRTDEVVVVAEMFGCSAEFLRARGEIYNLQHRVRWLEHEETSLLEKNERLEFEKRVIEGKVVEMAGALDKARLAEKKLIESSGEDFVKQSKEDLLRRERFFRWVGLVAYLAGASALAVVAAIAYFRPIDSERDVWSIVRFGLINVVVIVLLVALGKYLFTIGRAFMGEAVRNADRGHAISFGMFYLRAYGQVAERQEMRDAFRDWNIERASTFDGLKTRDFDPQLLEKLTDVLGKVVDSARKEKPLSTG